MAADALCTRLRAALGSCMVLRTRPPDCSGTASNRSGVRVRNGESFLLGGVLSRSYGCLDPAVDDGGQVFQKGINAPIPLARAFALPLK